MNESLLYPEKLVIHVRGQSFKGVDLVPATLMSLIICSGDVSFTSTAEKELKVMLVWAYPLRIVEMEKSCICLL